MKTPTLILSNVGDYCVTVTQSYELFRRCATPASRRGSSHIPSPGARHRTRFGNETRWTSCYDAVYSVGDLSGK
jgi:hypothetical protein